MLLRQKASSCVRIQHATIRGDAGKSLICPHMAPRDLFSAPAGVSAWQLSGHSILWPATAPPYSGPLRPCMPLEFCIRPEADSRLCWPCPGPELAGLGYSAALLPAAVGVGILVLTALSVNFFPGGSRSTGTGAACLRAPHAKASVARAFQL